MESLNVLSLFDGMSCGQIALKRIGVNVSKYFASEIKDHAIKVTKSNFPDTVEIGDVRNISFDGGTLKSDKGVFDVGNIDLLIGGSPCQDLSGMRHNREGLKGSKSSLFYEYMRIKEQVKPKYFLLENVATMSAEDKKNIDNLIGVEGVFINSSLFSAQLRRRYYWTNIPFERDIKDRGICLKDVIESGYTPRKKSVAIVRNYAGMVQSSNEESFKRMCNARAKKSFLSVVWEKENDPNSVRLFTRTELERLQTVPEGYTNAVTYAEAADLLGDGWTVDVIAHIFKGLKK